MFAFIRCPFKTAAAASGRPTQAMETAAAGVDSDQLLQHPGGGEGGESPRRGASPHHHQ